jgi:hypothetical protein
VGFGNFIKKSMRSGFQPTRWLGGDEVKTRGQQLGQMMKDLASPPVPNESQQLEQQAQASLLQSNAQERGLRLRLALVLMVFYSLVGIAFVGYSAYLFVAKQFFLPAAVTLMMSLLLFVYSFREFMVYGQLRLGVARLPLKILILKLKQLKAGAQS